ncbi:acyl-[acyl-carrier-protein] thioesterase [Paenibacillus albiflavus]|uniref:Acyl-[acyl-carrier-protein] thioesterase n=1 Tax=Paenibacillus albiflavus TaxID=2545760 RepID=A0A4R4E6E6_9BACL|nr:acyl-ACP thioesterase domain-containing protein [Paenibacillus albiflavus]TCZ75274.1 acyl-[acyl-carrier-protein] thioesterase [Paenibacillus albiflavus]
MRHLWNEQHLVQSDNCDYKRDCKLSTLLEWMQRAGDAHIASLGVSLEKLLAHDMAWMLTTIDLELTRMPRYGEEFEIETWNKEPKGVQWLRDFRLFGEGHEQIGQARTVWVLVDLNKRKILRSSAFPFEVAANTTDSIGDAPARVSIPAEIPLEEAYVWKVRYSSIDMNGHLNNARFADICLDALTTAELDAGLNRFRITYYQEAIMGEEITILRSVHSGSEIYIRGVSAESKVFFEAMISREAHK